MREEWKIVPFADKYEISNCGRVRRVGVDRFLIGKTNRKGYRIIEFYSGLDTSISKGLGRLVAEMFIPNPNKLPTVNHRDWDKKNNHVSNLEWCSYSDNTSYRGAQSNSKSGFKGVSWRRQTGKWRSQLRKNGKTVFHREFDNINDAIKAYSEAEREHFGRFSYYGSEYR